MPTLGLDHFNIRTTKLDETIAFFAEVVGLEVGERPNFAFPGAWMYAGGQPVIHLVEAQEPVGEGVNAADHIAFRCENPQEFRDRLNRLGLAFEERIVPQTRILQFFVKEPNGFSVELNFPNG